MRKGLLLWDIDGTLITSKSRHRFSLHQRALSPSPELFTWNEKGMSGHTDWQVLERLLYSQKSNPNLLTLQDAFRKIDELYEHDVKFNVTIERNEGINEDLFSSLMTCGWNLGVLTGNTKIRMQTKLLKAGLESYFEEKYKFFCESGNSRENILERALQKARKEFRTLIIVGDTPYDIKIAKESDSKCVAVGTGKYGKEELIFLNPDLFINNFHNDLEIFHAFLEKL
jgi:phosphoglycolate phosphatase